MPQRPGHTAVFVPSVAKGIAAVRGFNDGNTPVYPERNLRISGTTKDSTGVALAGCRVCLFDKTTDLFLDAVISDANGNFTIQINNGLSQPQVTAWYLVAYKPGGTDVAGTTVNSLVGT